MFDFYPGPPHTLVRPCMDVCAKDQKAWVLLWLKLCDQLQVPISAEALLTGNQWVGQKLPQASLVGGVLLQGNHVFRKVTMY